MDTAPKDLKGGTGKAEDAKLPDAGISLKQCQENEWQKKSGLLNQEDRCGVRGGSTRPTTAEHGKDQMSAKRRSRPREWESRPAWTREDQDPVQNRWWTNGEKTLLLECALSRKPAALHGLLVHSAVSRSRGNSLRRSETT